MADALESSGRGLFLKHFGFEPEVSVEAPGRIEVLGNHTDYNEGFVLSKTVRQRVSASLAKIDAKVIKVISSINPSVEHLIKFDELESNKVSGWVIYIQGILIELSKRFELSSGVAISIDSTVPLSAGMSSSAALEIAVISGLDVLFQIGLTPMEKAKVGQLTENLYTGAKTGRMDLGLWKARASASQRV